ncbi:MAG TPA: carbon-nitrogen hydrolase family protein [Spirochaetia bacterium]|nr:carbon-nitrogen hydrolase family protein [Spirochaetia bacterium]
MKATLACGQFAPAAGRLSRNIDRISSFAHEASARGAAILVLPELCLCGYPPADKAREWAVRTDGPEMARLADAARVNAVALCAGFAELAADGALYNSAAYFDRRGALRAVYRKVHLWTTEKEWARPGGSFTTWTDGGLRMGAWICYDSRFPEAARSLARAGTRLALVGSAWFGPPEEWELAVRARAMDNGIFVAGASVLGTFGSTPFRGASLISDPHGRVIAQAEPGVEQLITAPYDDEAVESCRARIPLLAHLRPETYG